MTDERPDPPPPGPILLCAGTDPSAATRLAEVAAALLVERPAVVLATWEPPPLAGLGSLMDALYDSHEDLRAAARDHASQTARAAGDALDARGIHVTRRICPEEQAPWREILDLADRVDASVIVAGTGEVAFREPGSLGGQARALAHRTHRPLLLIPPERVPDAVAAPAIFASDGSPDAGLAVSCAVALLRPRPAVVASVWHTADHIVGVAMVAVADDVVRRGADALDEAARIHAAGVAGEAAATLTAAGWSCETAALRTSRNVPSAIVACADEHDAAVVVTGTRGRSRMAAALLGSSAEGILRHAGRPVLLVPEPAPTPTVRPPA